VGRSSTDLNRGLWVRKEIKRRNMREINSYGGVE
jgi:hypothetical protein